MGENAHSTENSSRRHETADVEVRTILMFAAGVAALFLAGLLASAGVFHYFVTHQSLGPQASPFENLRTLPPELRLQVQAPVDLKRYRASQEQILGSYGWVDPSAGVVRIPIERAEEILLQKGFPVRGGARENPVARTR